MNKLITATTLLIGLLITGCSSIGDKRVTWFNEAIEGKRWSSAFRAFTNITLFGTATEKDTAVLIAKQHSEIAQAGLDEYSEQSLKKQTTTHNAVDPDIWQRVNALCLLISEGQCETVRQQVYEAIASIKPEATILRSAFEKLNESEKDELKKRYVIGSYDDSEIGIITERQVQDVSQAGSSAGSEVGSSLASAVYVNKAISSGSYNMWTDLAVGILGGVAGAGGNKAPVKQYIIKYTVRTLDNQLKSDEIINTSPIGESVGSCYSLTRSKSVDQSFCSMTADVIREKYLTKQSERLN